ncbi:hypothetical protein E2C01_055027 [Portunus trituberculatus]|uniref:Uncharacterized protein n=1 Tax=Portunus trituberculatus TaxID=210409 RepID=A0A5B7GU71_PORTR|nr:hypothetical protein [Portunus trituberculatus]
MRPSPHSSQCHYLSFLLCGTTNLRNAWAASLFLPPSLPPAARTKQRGSPYLLLDHTVGPSFHPAPLLLSRDACGSSPGRGLEGVEEQRHNWPHSILAASVSPDRRSWAGARDARLLRYRGRVGRVSGVLREGGSEGEGSEHCDVKHYLVMNY